MRDLALDARASGSTTKTTTVLGADPVVGAPAVYNEDRGFGRLGWRSANPRGCGYEQDGRCGAKNRCLALSWGGATLHTDGVGVTRYANVVSFWGGAALRAEVTSDSEVF
ncbi:hypothetical protein PC119_g24128 [Phytophthora cactorum]|nr:hypothetical protein PC114_g24721 [Phytophthora cactorum]KAG2968730.1 hypothetical protein PC119_g24128 [Phytophthora cactorum]KAG3128014.1 hypothetical protein C6341_g24746 [Phytophthora cactorum]KAG4043413.1 hypothetical protein PC123_g21122 [Phytophthora cactorum]